MGFSNKVTEQSLMSYKGIERVKENQKDGEALRVKQLGIHYHPWG